MRILSMFAVTISSVLVLACGGGSKDNNGNDLSAQDLGESDLGADVGDPGDTTDKPDDSVGSEDNVDREGQVEPDGNEDDVQLPDQEDPEDVAEPDTKPGQVFVPPPATATYMYRVGVPGEANPVDMPARYGDKEMYNGHEYRLMEIGDFTKETITGVHIWALYENDTFRTGGAEVYNPGKLGEPSFAYAFDEPLIGNLNGGIGEEQVTETTGKFIIGGTEMPFEIELTYILLGTDESVEVPAGTFDGCIHYKIIENSTDLQGFESEYWLKSGVGMIKGTVFPGFDALELVSYNIP